MKSLSPTARGYLLIHLCVVLWGFTSIFGRLITLDALELVWWRMVIAAGVLLLVPAVWRPLRRMPRRLILAYCGIGVLLTGNWTLFYFAIKLANASVGAICIGTAPMFLALVEPALAHRRFSLREGLIGLGTIPGIAMIVGGIPARMYVGFGVGMASVLCIVFFSIFNKRLIERAPPATLTFIEVATGAVLLSVVTALLPHGDAAFVLPQGRNLWLLLVLSIGLTLLPMIMLFMALHHISAFAQQVATNLEPVYAVLLAIPILGEQRQLGPLFYAGVVVIVGTAIAEPLIAALRARHPVEVPPRGQPQLAAHAVNSAALPPGGHP
ncbi:MAG TPA: DMT family transporter [Nevskiaceae bacterium]